MLNGAKNWITNSPIADVCLVWAKTSTDNKVLFSKPSTRPCCGVPWQVRGFLVERGMEDLRHVWKHLTDNRKCQRASPLRRSRASFLFGHLPRSWS